MPVTIRAINGIKYSIEISLSDIQRKKNYLTLRLSILIYEKELTDRFIANEIMSFQIRVDNTVIYDDNKIGVRSRHPYFSSLMLLTGKEL